MTLIPVCRGGDVPPPGTHQAQTAAGPFNEDEQGPWVTGTQLEAQGDAHPELGVIITSVKTEVISS